MPRKILATLDGSALSEAAIAPAADLARRLGAELVLLHVIEARPPRLVHGERHLMTAGEAEEYLAPIAARLSSTGLRTAYHVHEGAGREAAGSRGVASVLAAHEDELGGDLAVMAAHGARGLSDALSGSLPLKVAASGGAAVLLVPGGNERTAGRDGGALAPRRVVLPLDGRAEHEAAIPAAAELAGAYGVPVLLLAVVPRNAAEAGGPGAVFARLAPALSGESLELAARESGAYLEGIAAALSKDGIGVELRVVRGRPGKAIVAACGEGDILALSTHRKLGLDASLDGCVAFDACRRWRGAALVVPVPRAAR